MPNFVRSPETRDRLLYNTNVTIPVHTMSMFRPCNPNVLYQYPSNKPPLPKHSRHPLANVTYPQALFLCIRPASSWATHLVPFRSCCLRSALPTAPGGILLLSDAMSANPNRGWHRTMSILIHRALSYIWPTYLGGCTSIFATAMPSAG